VVAVTGDGTNDAPAFEEKPTSAWRWGHRRHGSVEEASKIGCSTTL